MSRYDLNEQLIDKIKSHVYVNMHGLCSLAYSVFSIGIVSISDLSDGRYIVNGTLVADNICYDWHANVNRDRNDPAKFDVVVHRVRNFR